jgi:hypothetical protein
MTLEEAAYKMGKHVSCLDKKAPRPLCGNVSYHTMTTRNIKEVNCPICLEKLRK